MQDIPVPAGGIPAVCGGHQHSGDLPHHPRGQVRRGLRQSQDQVLRQGTVSVFLPTTIGDYFTIIGAFVNLL